MESEFFFDVRGYELDSFGHVNNAVYLNYFEAARWDSIRKMDWINYTNENGLFPVIVEANIRYLSELKMFDNAFIKTKWRNEGIHLITDQSIYLVGSKKKIAKATAKIVLVSDERIVHEIPEFIINKLS